MSSEFGKLILYIWKSFPFKISAARANFLRLFSSSKRFWFSFFTFKRGVIQTSVEYLNQFLIDTHFTSITRSSFPFLNFWYIHATEDADLRQRKLGLLDLMSP